MKLMRAALFTVCAAAAAAGQSTVLFNEPFNDNSAGWTLGTQWEIGPATVSTGGISGCNDPGADGDGVAGGGLAGMVVGGLFSNSPFAFRWLTGPAIDATGMPNLMLTFRRKLCAHALAFATHRIDVFDGTNWVAIWTAVPATGTFFEDSAWVSQSFNVTQYANAAFAVRFGTRRDASNSGASAGWSVDNVKLTSFAPSQNDSCANATVLALGDTAGHLWEATPTDPQPASCGSFTTTTIDCWYAFVPATAGGIKITRSGGTRMALYTGADCGNLTLVPGRCGTGATFNNVAVSAGQTYWLRLGGNANTTHTITVELAASLATIGVGSPVGTVLSASGAPVLGSVGTITLDAEPFRFGLLLIAPPNDANVYTPIGVGTIYLANPGLAVLLSYYTDAAGQWSLTVPFPTDPAFTGFALELQCLNFGPFAPETSNALRLVMGP